MDVAFVAFDGMTALDLVSVYDPVTRLAVLGLVELEWSLCALTSEVTDDRGLTMLVDCVEEPLDEFDLVIVPGGRATRHLRYDEEMVEWIATACEAEMVASVCSGALLLGAAGLLEGYQATTHPAALGLLKDYGALPVRSRVVDQGARVTSGGVTAGIDLGLHLVERLAGFEARQRIARQMDYV